MTTKRVLLAERYAEAFLAYSRETIGEKKAIEEFQRLKNVLRQNDSLEDFLQNPQFAYKEKCTIIDNSLQEMFSAEMLQFIKLLLAKNRIAFLQDIMDYVRVKYSHGDTIEAVIKTSYPLDIDVLQIIKTKMENKLGKKLNLYIELDPDLLGGIYMRVGNKVIDGSVRHSLDKLKEELLAIRVQ
jgi:F-type H+-transporting ATPase subunit delta